MTEYEERLAERISEELYARHEEAERCHMKQKICEWIAGGFLLATVVCGAGIETAVSLPFQVVLTLLMASCGFTAYLCSVGWKMAVEELEGRDLWQR